MDQPYHLIPQRSNAWLQARKQMDITSSHAGDVCGCGFMSAGKYFDKITNFKYGGYVEDSGKPNAYVQRFLDWGTSYEPICHADVEQKFGHTIGESGMWVNPDYKRIGGSPDGLVAELTDGWDVTLMEFKCPYSLNIPDVPPPKYMCQVQTCMALIGDPKTCELTYWTPNNGRRTFFIDFDIDIWDSIYQRMRDFQACKNAGRRPKRRKAFKPLVDTEFEDW